MTIDKDQWELYNINYRSLMAQGETLERIKLYDESIYENIKYIYYNYIPAVVLLLENSFVIGECYKRSKLLAYALNNENSEIIKAKIDGLKYNPKYAEKYENDDYAIHYYVRTTEEDGKTWVYDTSMGLKIDESLYNMMQHPEILSIEKGPFKTDSLGLNIYKNSKLKTKAYYIKDSIDKLKFDYIFKFNYTPVKEEYRNVIIEELRKIENMLDISEENSKVYAKTTKN